MYYSRLFFCFCVNYYYNILNQEMHQNSEIFYHNSVWITLLATSPNSSRTHFRQRQDTVGGLNYVYVFRVLLYVSGHDKV